MADRAVGALRWRTVRRQVYALVFASTALGACGDDPVVSGGVVDRIEVAVRELRFDALGDRIVLTATAFDAGGGEVSVPFQWLSADPSVVTVGTRGEVESVGDGSTTLRVTAAGVSATVSVQVEQRFHSAHFDGLDIALLDGVVLDLDVRLVDRLGSEMRGLNGALSLQAGGPGGFTVAGTQQVPLNEGVAHFGGLTLSGAGFDRRLLVSGAGVNTSSPLFDLVTAFDVVATEVQGEVGVMIDGVSAGTQRNDVLRKGTGSGFEVGAFRPGGAGSVTVFASGRAPVLRDVSWSEGPDSLRVQTDAEVTVDLAVWIVKGPIQQQTDWAALAIERTREIWAAERYGIAIGDVEVIDATADPDAPTFYEFNGCGERTNAETRIGRRPGRINVYYLERVDGGTDRGRTCPVGGDFIVMAERSGDELLSHEIGHAFGLIHIDLLTEDFDRTNVMHSASSTRAYLTEAQTFRSHFDERSALNGALGARSGPTRACPGLGGSLECPTIALRIWQDGGFPASLPDGSEGAHPVAALVRRWLGTDCVMEGNESLDADLARAGDEGVEALWVVVEDPAVSEILRIRAVHGLGRVADPSASARLVALAEHPSFRVRREAVAMLERRASAVPRP